MNDQSIEINFQPILEAVQNFPVVGHWIVYIIASYFLGFFLVRSMVRKELTKKKGFPDYEVPLPVKAVGSFVSCPIWMVPYLFFMFIWKILTIGNKSK